MKWARATVVVAVLGLGTGAFGSITSGCSSSTTGQGSPSSAHAEQVIGAQGGDVAVPDGTGVNIPAGALPAGVNVTVSAEPDAATPSGGRTVSTPYVFGPEGQKFNLPVTVTLAFDPTLLPPGKKSSDIFVYTAPAGTTAYEPLVTTLVDSTHIAAQVMHFSVFCGFVPNTPPDLDAGNGDDGSAPEVDSSAGTDASQGEPDSSLPPDDGSTTTDSGGGAHDSGTNQNDGGGTIDDAGSGSDATVTSDAGSGGGNDGGAVSDDAGIPNFDAGGGSSDAGITSDGGGGSTCNPQTRWPTMNASAFSPPSQFAGIDWQNGALTVDQAMTIDCNGQPAAPQQDTNDQAFTWGNTQDVYVEFNPQTRLPYFLSMQKAYAGTLTLFSRVNGAYGNHTYVLGIGAITRDSSPFTIDWVNGPAPAVTELFDAYLATLFPAQPAAPTNCGTSGDCLINEDNLDGTGVFGFRPNAEVYFVVTKDTSTVTVVYTFFKSNSPAPDGGGGGNSDAGCVAQNNCGPQTCGTAPNGCGQLLQCGPPCDGGGGVFDGGGGGGPTDASASPDSGTCVPQNFCGPQICGFAPNGCGGAVQCGPPCDGGGGTSDAGGGGGPQDASPGDGGACQPLPFQVVCASSCGLQSNGCGQIYQCAPCSGDAGSGGGADAGSCVAQNVCALKQITCGNIMDNCGNPEQCGPPCADGGGGADAGSCTPVNVCGLKNITCGSILDNCGNPEQCGPPCGDGGGGGADAGSCTPVDVCGLKNITCGSVLDNCGNPEPCGPPCDAGPPQDAGPAPDGSLAGP